MSDFRFIPLKKPYEVDIIKPLKNVMSLIKNTAKTTQDFSNQINELSRLRNLALWKAYDRRDDALEEIYNYFDQINGLEKKIPARELQIPFKWKDAFSKGIFLSRNSLTIPSLGYEKMCVLFNIAALQSYFGKKSNLDDDESLKQAAKLFQQSAGIFDYLKNNVTRTLQRETTPDLHPDTLHALTCLMLAQAQEVFMYKAKQDKMKNELISKICNETSFLYSDSLRAIQSPNISNLWDKDTIPTVSGKQTLFRGMAEYYQSLESKSKKSVGEHIARLRVAIECFKTALKLSSKLIQASDLISEAEQLLKEAVRDNDCIFHDKIPDSSTLSSIARASLVKPLPLPQKFSNDFRDLFADLIPAAVQKALISFEARKQEIIQSEVFKLREATQLLNGILASLNLPAAIEETIEQEIPRSLVTKSTTVRNNGGTATIERMLDRMPGLQTRNTEILEDIEKMLNDEEQSDDQLRRKYKELWSRKNSSRLTSSFRTNLEKYRRTINTAIQADKTVRSKFEDHQINIVLLGEGPAALAQAVPQADLKKAYDSPSMSRLKELMKQVDFIKEGRDIIEGELKSVKEDTKDTLLAALDKDNFDEQSVLQHALKVTYEPIQQKVQESIKAQESLIEDIQRVNAQFIIDRKELDIASQEREKVLKNLAAAYDAYMEISNNLQEGSTFYNDLTEVLLLFQSKVADFCFARKTEKEELLKDLEKFETSKTQGISARFSNFNQLNTNRPQQQMGADSAAACSTSQDLPYPAFPQNMPMPYGSQHQLPYPPYFIPTLPSVYYTVPPPSPAYQPPQQDPKHNPIDQNPPSS